jgi:hypothetical protein
MVWKMEKGVLGFAGGVLIAGLGVYQGGRLGGFLWIGFIAIIDMRHSQSVYTLFDVTDANRDLQGHETGNMEKLSSTFPSSLVIIAAGSYNSGVIELHHIDIFEPLLLICLQVLNSHKFKTQLRIRTYRTIRSWQASNPN